MLLWSFFAMREGTQNWDWYWVGCQKVLIPWYPWETGHRVTKYQDVHIPYMKWYGICMQSVHILLVCFKLPLCFLTTSSNVNAIEIVHMLYYLGNDSEKSFVHFSTDANYKNTIFSFHSGLILQIWD